MSSVALWLAGFVAIGGLAAYEVAGILPWTPFHTISFFAAKKPWLHWLIAAGFLALGVSGAVWFGWLHLSRGIAK